jgi:hypothetical protein
VITEEAVVELEAEDEQALHERIAAEDYHEDELQPASADFFIEDIECLDEDPDEDDDT